MPSPISAPKVCASLDGNHDIELLASGDMCLRRVSIPRRLCALFLAVLSFRSPFGSSRYYLRIIALSRISAIRLLADASSRASPQQHRLCLLIRSVPLFRLSAGQPLQVSDRASCLCSACAIVASVDTLRT